MDKLAIMKKNMKLSEVDKRVLLTYAAMITESAVKPIATTKDNSKALKII